jgi:histidine triad (HIT) family protein
VASVFSQIITGELPARFVWKDDRCVAFLAARPLKPGHTLVVPRDEIDHWIDLPPPLLHHLWSIAQRVASAMQAALRPVKVGVMVAGLEVRHVHIHLVPITELGDLNFGKQDPHPDPSMMDRAAETIRLALPK